MNRLRGFCKYPLSIEGVNVASRCTTKIAPPKELTFDVNGLRLTAKTWGDPAGTPTLALHGWLDNANTFDALAPLLRELDLVAPDFAGHGFSSHRPAGVHYTSFADVQDAIAIATNSAGNDSTSSGIRWAQASRVNSPGCSRNGSCAR